MYVPSLRYTENNSDDYSKQTNKNNRCAIYFLNVQGKDKVNTRIQTRTQSVDLGFPTLSFSADGSTLFSSMSKWS